MATVTPFHSTANAARPVFHDDNRCKSGRSIDTPDRSDGTGGMEKCDECERLAPGRWVEMDDAGPSTRRHGMGMRWQK